MTVRCFSIPMIVPKKSSDKIYVVSDSSHIQHVREQLSELPEDAFIVEPARRGTASCIVAALAYIRERHDHDEPIAFIAADHYIRDTVGFRRSFRIANKISSSEKRITLVGVEPDHPGDRPGLHTERRSSWMKIYTSTMFTVLRKSRSLT